MIHKNKNTEIIYNNLIVMLGDKFQENRDEINISILAYHIDVINRCNKAMDELGTLVFVAESGYRQKWADLSIIADSQKEIIKISSLYGLSLKHEQQLNDLSSKEAFDLLDDEF